MSEDIWVKKSEVKQKNFAIYMPNIGLPPDEVKRILSRKIKDILDTYLNFHSTIKQ